MSTRKHTSTLYVCARASSLSFAHPQDLMRSRSSHGTKQHKSGDCPRTELSEDTPNYEVATFENRNLLFRSADKVQMSPTPMAHERGSAGLLTDTPQPASALPIRHKGLQPAASLQHIASRWIWKARSREIPLFSLHIKIMNSGGGLLLRQPSSVSMYDSNSAQST